MIHLGEGFPDAVGELPGREVRLESADIADVPDMIADAIGLGIGVR